jgi:hypothetical protein
MSDYSSLRLEQYLYVIYVRRHQVQSLLSSLYFGNHVHAVKLKRDMVMYRKVIL